MSGVPPALFRRAMKQALGLAAMLSLMLLVTGCNGGGTPTKADHSGSAARNARGEGTTLAARPASDAPGSGPQTIPGMNADAVAAIFLKPGLECFDPVDRDVLYACSSEDNHDMAL